MLDVGQDTLRIELQRSQDRGRGQAMSFAVDKVELELKVAVSRKAKAEGGVQFWVLKAGAAAEGQHDSVHTFKLTLSPVAAASQQSLTPVQPGATPVVAAPAAGAPGSSRVIISNTGGDVPSNA